VVLVEDNGPIHTSKLSLAALAARAHWLTVEWLPKYAPELNDIEAVGTISRRIISPIRPSLTLTHLIGLSIKPWTR
jgi:transposase